MKTRSNSIHIAEPCLQSWEEMEKHEGSRFCESCNKCVIDFSRMSTADIWKVLSNTHSEICGRLSKTQLESLNNYQLVKPANGNWMKYLGVLAIGIGVFSFSANAQVKSHPVTQAQTSVGQKNQRESDPKILKAYYGYMFASDKKPISGLKLRIKGTDHTAVTDRNGRYEFKLDGQFDRAFETIIADHKTLIVDLKINFNQSRQADFYPYRVENMIMGEIIMPAKKESKKL